MKKNWLSLFSALALVFLFGGAPIANAAKNNTNFLNGKPFSTLNDSIEENAAAIEANTTAIGALEADFVALQAIVDSIEVHIADMDTRITANKDSITQALNDISLLSSDLDALRQAHVDDLAAINLTVADLEALINQTQVNLDNAVASLQLQLANLEASTGADIDALIVKTTGLMGDVIVLNNTLQNQQILISDLQTSQSDLENMIAGLEIREAALEGRVSTLEAFHKTFPEQCEMGNDPGTNAPWVVCSADENEAWISANTSGQFHFEQICRDLGYAGAGNWEGTCGNVCGYCQGTTSCTNHGTKKHTRPASSPNCGSDGEGGIICNTVSWLCVN